MKRPVRQHGSFYLVGVRVLRARHEIPVRERRDDAHVSLLFVRPEQLRAASHSTIRSHQAAWSCRSTWGQFGVREAREAQSIPRPSEGAAEAALPVVLGIVALISK
jgi:hypothetical protein